MSKNLSKLSGRKGLTDNLFERIGDLSEKTGSPDREELKKLAEEFLIGAANTYGAATFYDFMKPENRGKEVYVCNGSVCLCAGTQEKLVESLEQFFEPDQIGHMCCLGRCHENAAFHYKGKNYSGVTNGRLKEIIEGKGDNEDRYEVAAGGKQILTAEFPGMDEFYSLLDEVLKTDPEEVLEEVKLSNVRGRGGAGFPMGMKLEFCRKAKSHTKFIICNADEGDPGAYSDRYLLEKRPHFVLFGMMVAGYVCGAEWGVVYIRAEYPESVEAVQQAIDELRSRGWLGKQIMGSEFNFDLKIIEARGSYICGEETALINSIEGQRPEVRVRPPYPAQEGLFGEPTIVNNVETLATLYYILEKGGKAFASIGTEKSNGTKLVCLDSGFKRPGMYEVEMGMPLRKVVDELGGGFAKPVKALHIGGPLGGLVPVSMIDKLTVDFESFAQHGFLLGHASVVSIPAEMPLVKYLEHLFEFAADESCGKCFPCRLGTRRAQEMLHKVQHGEYRIDKQLFDDLLHALEIGSLCAHGGGIPLPVRNAMTHFEGELARYFE